MKSSFTPVAEAGYNVVIDELGRTYDSTINLFLHIDMSTSNWADLGPATQAALVHGIVSLEA